MAFLTAVVRDRIQSSAIADANSLDCKLDPTQIDRYQQYRR